MIALFHVRYTDDFRKWTTVSLLLQVYDLIFYFTTCSLIDSAFSNRGNLHSKILRSLKQSEIDAISDISEKKRQVSLHRLAVSIRQGAEWGNHTYTGTWARLTRKMTGDSRKRRLILETCVYLHNFRTRVLGLG